MSIGYEEIWAEAGDYRGLYGCSICGGIARTLSRHPLTWQLNHSEHLLAHCLEYVAFDNLPLGVQAEAQAEFGNRWYQEFWYYRHQISGEFVAVDVTED